MTLLELLLATTILAAITAMVSALWAQTRDWSQENARPEQALRLPRVLQLFEDQWSRRRAVADDGEEGADAESALLLNKDRLEFITAEPILFPDWPLVRASYIAQRDERLTVGAESTVTLVYEETRVTNPNAPAASSEGADGAKTRKRAVLLEDCGEVRFERYATTEADGVNHPSAPASQPLARLWDEPAPANVGENADGTDQNGSSGDDLRAGRIAGEYRGESFSWVFIVEGSLSY